MKAKMICMAYCMKAIMSPICNEEAAISCAPTQIIATLRPEKTRFISGKSDSNDRPIKRILSVRSRLARSKRFSSKLCLLKARITSMPERFSRNTRLIRSIRVCIFWKRGMTMIMVVTMMMITIATAAAISHHMPGLFCSARMMPIVAISGAVNAIRMIKKVSCCICSTSLVVRVIREAVEKFSNSALE